MFDFTPTLIELCQNFNVLSATSDHLFQGVFCGTEVYYIFGWWIKPNARLYFQLTTPMQLIVTKSIKKLVLCIIFCSAWQRAIRSRKVLSFHLIVYFTEHWGLTSVLKVEQHSKSEPVVSSYFKNTGEKLVQTQPVGSRIQKKLENSSWCELVQWKQNKHFLTVNLYKTYTRHMQGSECLINNKYKHRKK